MITGNTRLFAILADPVAQVRTPQVLNEHFAAHGLDAILVPMHVASTDLEEVLSGLRRMKNLSGFVVTVPHKIAMASLCDELGPAARAIGSVNTVRRTVDGRLMGEMFDGAGFVGGLLAQGHDPDGKRVLLLGAGGAASAIAFALSGAGARRVTVANRTRAKAETVVEHVRRALPQADIAVGDADPRGYDMVVNATSLGMRPEDPLPMDVSGLEPRTLVAEIIMKPEVTPLLEAARQRGCTVHYGRHMLDCQVVLMVRFMLDQA
ncbi:MAG: shikimate dehydrogenase [Castellaniella sp.]|uniref:shikimate dehydrogenase family protein n=1 Tax=Castellaniella sp. TaxID=1955812 RepID=UPI0012036053|nr:shikimate dehydrogenase [Castellaniella sp.]TAN30800.1 MAG: shikimate dehydrogenase [Castellaniella sp.]